MSFEGYAQIGRTLVRVLYVECDNVTPVLTEYVPALTIAMDRVVSESGEVYENMKPETVPLCPACRKGE